MEKSIVSGKGLTNIAALIVLFFVASVLSSCGNSATLTPEEFEAFLAERETIPVQVAQTTPEGETLFKVPNTLINDCYLDGSRNYCLVLRKINKDGKTYLQFVKAEIVASNDTYQTVKRLNLNMGDSFLPSPQTLLPELAHKNKLETRKRFLRVQRY